MEESVGGAARRRGWKREEKEEEEEGEKKIEYKQWESEERQGMCGSNFCSENIGGKIPREGQEAVCCFHGLELEKAYDRVDMKGLWDTLRLYGVGGKLLEGIRSFYENASASEQVSGELSESFNIEVGD